LTFGFFGWLGSERSGEERIGVSLSLSLFFALLAASLFCFGYLLLLRKFHNDNYYL
jgi:hypothetical protein